MKDISIDVDNQLTTIKNGTKLGAINFFLIKFFLILVHLIFIFQPNGYFPHKYTILPLSLCVGLMFFKRISYQIQKLFSFSFFFFASRHDTK